MKSQGKTAVHIFVFGRVQGVGFRAWAASAARRVGIAGWVRNCPDDSVELVAEGECDDIRAFTELLEKGNGYSRTDTLSVNEAQVQGFLDFEIEM